MARLVDHLRSLLRSLEGANVPVPVKVAARAARRAGRSILATARSTRTALDPKALKRNLLFPIRNLLFRHKPITVDAGGESFFLVPHGVVPVHIWSGGYFEKHELEFILSLLRPGMTFVDAGANVGLFSIPAAMKVQHGKVFSFEPTSWTFERLVENARLNNLTNLLAVQSALGDKTGETTLQINLPGKDGLNTIGRPTHIDSAIVRTETVPITTLDHYLSQSSIPSVDVMKMDVEGAELLVLRGAKGLLSRPDAPLLLYESGFLSKGFDYHPVEQMWLLEKCGYRFFLIDSNTGKISIPANGRAYDAMVIAVKPSHPSYGAILERAA